MHADVIVPGVLEVEYYDAFQEAVAQAKERPDIARAIVGRPGWNEPTLRMVIHDPTWGLPRSSFWGPSCWISDSDIEDRWLEPRLLAITKGLWRTNPEAQTRWVRGLPMRLTSALFNLTQADAEAILSTRPAAVAELPRRLQRLEDWLVALQENPNLSMRNMSADCVKQLERWGREKENQELYEIYALRMSSGRQLKRRSIPAGRQRFELLIEEVLSENPAAVNSALMTITDLSSYGRYRSLEGLVGEIQRLLDLSPDRQRSSPPRNFPARRADQIPTSWWALLMRRIGDQPLPPHFQPRAHVPEDLQELKRLAGLQYQLLCLDAAQRQGRVIPQDLIDNAIANLTRPIPGETLPAYSIDALIQALDRLGGEPANWDAPDNHEIALLTQLFKNSGHLQPNASQALAILDRLKDETVATLRHSKTILEALKKALQNPKHSPSLGARPRVVEWLVYRKLLSLPLAAQVIRDNPLTAEAYIGSKGLHEVAVEVLIQAEPALLGAYLDQHSHPARLRKIAANEPVDPPAGTWAPSGKPLAQSSSVPIEDEQWSF